MTPEEIAFWREVFDVRSSAALLGVTLDDRHENARRLAALFGYEIQEEHHE